MRTHMPTQVISGSRNYNPRAMGTKRLNVYSARYFDMTQRNGVLSLFNIVAYSGESAYRTAHVTAVA
jgi:hypothetical protein